MINNIKHKNLHVTLQVANTLESNLLDLFPNNLTFPFCVVARYSNLLRNTLGCKIC